MTDHLTKARAAYAAAVATGWPEDALTEVVAHILDHLKAEQAPQQLAASIRPRYSVRPAAASARPRRFADDEPEPEPDYGPRPAGCCGACPPILGGGYDCTCADNPRCDANKADRYDCDGDPWVWCDECGGFRMSYHKEHDAAMGWPAYRIYERYGPLTFAPRPAEPPATAPQPDEAHGDADEPTKPNLNVQTAPSIPTTQQVRREYVSGRAEAESAMSYDPQYEPEFDRWLAAHDAELREQLAAEGLL